MGLSKERGLYFQEKWEEMQYRFANIEMKREIERLKSQLQQKENKEKEIREYIEKYSIMYEHEIEPYKVVESEELLEILDKENK